MRLKAMIYTLTRDDMPLLSQWIKKSKSEDLDFLSMGYKKDIFGSFAYDFELLQNGISLCDMI